MMDFNHTEDWLAARARVSPNHPFIYGPDGFSLTFEEIEIFVADQAQRLHKHIHPGQHVGVLTINDAESVIDLLSLIRIGAVVVPINTRLTSAEIKDQLIRSDTTVVMQLTEPKLRSTINEIKTELQIIDPLTLPNEKDFKPRPFNLSDPFAIIHTSGTSGTPKGAVLSYGNIFYSAMASAYRLGVQPNDRWLCPLPLYHVGGLSILLRSILYGTSVDLLHHFSEVVIGEKLTREPITMISLVPTMLYRLLKAEKRVWNPDFRLVLLGGAAPSQELIQQCIDQRIPVATTYGLTESASQVATATPQQVTHKSGSVGKPLMFTSVRIVDETGTTQPPNQYGEVLVSGPTVMMEYYKNREANAKTLKNGELHTGDIGYLDAEGDLWLVQRRSDLIVTGGENVYPAEVEQVLSQHPLIHDCAVVGIPHSEWGQQVAAAIVLAAENTISADELQIYCRQYIAGYKIPRQFKFVDQLPQTPSGKIQRSAVVELFDAD